MTSWRCWRRLSDEVEAPDAAVVIEARLRGVQVSDGHFGAGGMSVRDSGSRPWMASFKVLYVGKSELSPGRRRG